MDREIWELRKHVMALLRGPQADEFMEAAERFVADLASVPPEEQPAYLDRLGHTELADPIRAGGAVEACDADLDRAGERDGDCGDHLACPFCSVSPVLLGPKDSWLCANCGVTGSYEFVDVEVSEHENDGVGPVY